MSRPIQISLFQLDNYGPWTVTPAPRRETDLQALQARLYADLADFVGGADGYVFYDRFDNMIAVTNGMDLEDHRQFQRRVRNQYPITVSIAVGVSETPVDALEVAARKLQQTGSAQDPDRTERLVHAGPSSESESGSGSTSVSTSTPTSTSTSASSSPSTSNPNSTSDPVTIAHFDIVDVTGEFTDRKHPAATTLAVQRATLELETVLYEEFDSLARFVGGDNIIAVCPPLEAADFDAARAHVLAETGIDLQVGIGRGESAHEAGYRAKLALEECRETGSRRHEYQPRAPAEH